MLMRYTVHMTINPPRPVQKGFGLLLWDLEARAGHYLRLWPLQTGSGRIPQMVCALETEDGRAAGPATGAEVRIVAHGAPFCGTGPVGRQRQRLDTLSSREQLGYGKLRRCPFLCRCAGQSQHRSGGRPLADGGGSCCPRPAAPHPSRASGSQRCRGRGVGGRAMSRVCDDSQARPVTIFPSIGEFRPS